jgi:hypothetical protein
MVDHKATTYRPRRAFIEPEIEPAEPKYPARPDRDSGMPIAPPVVDEEPPKPLYRDEPRTNGWSSRQTLIPRCPSPPARSVRAESTRKLLRSSPAVGRTSIAALPSTRSTTTTTSESR